MEANIRRIVIGFDFSPASRAALEAGVGLARRTGASIHVVTSVYGAIDDKVLRPLRHGQKRGKWRRNYLDEVGYLEEVERLVRAEVGRSDVEHVEIDYDIGELPPAKQLMATAHTLEADMILVGSRGNSDPKHGHQVGVDVERLVRQSMLPVLVLRPELDFPPKRILCAVDFSEASERALGWAVDMAQLRGKDATLDVVHVFKPSRASVKKGPESVTAERTTSQKQLREFVSSFSNSGVQMHWQLVEGLPHQMLLNRLNEISYDLLCIGTLGRSALVEMLVGGTAERVIRSAPTAILAVKPDSLAVTDGKSGSFKAITGQFRALK